jgi:site-specific recombinase XerD
MVTKKAPSPKRLSKALKQSSATQPLPNSKNRSVVPIKSTIEAIKGFPSKLVIFKIPASQFYWVRYYDGKPLKRSTKTESKAEAIRFAKAFYEELVVNKKLGISNTKHQTSFVLCANAVIKDDEFRAGRKELSESYVQSQKNIISKHTMAFFKQYEISEIEYAHLDKFKTYLVEKGLKNGSIKVHFSALSKIFQYAQRNNIIKSSPLMPKVKNEDNARGYFNLDEYKLLTRAVRKLVGSVSEIRQKVDDEKSIKLRNVLMTEEMKHLIPFMLYTFIRPTDLKNIQHRHIEVKEGEEGEYLFLSLPTSKRHNKPITSMPRASIAYKKLRNLEIAQLEDEKQSIANRYVFMSQHANRDYAYRQIARQFDVLMSVTGLKESVDGETRTLYSMRHTSLMYRLLYGGEINTTKLANNARTSTEMLERFYVPQLESSQFTKDLHAKKRKPKKESKKESKLIISEPVLPEVLDMADEIGKHLKKKGIKKGITFNADGESFVIK